MNEVDVVDAISAALEGVPGVVRVQVLSGSIDSESITGVLPAIFIERRPKELADDLGSGASARDLSFAVFVIFSANADDSEVGVSEMTELVLQRIERSNWGLSDLGLAVNVEVVWDDISPDQDKWLIRSVEFSHLALLG